MRSASMHFIHKTNSVLIWIAMIYFVPGHLKYWSDSSFAEFTNTLVLKPKRNNLIIAELGRFNFQHGENNQRD